MSLSKQVIGGAGLIALAGAASRILSFITVPILSNLLGPESYGIAAQASAVVSLGAVLSLLGIDMAYARFYLQEEPLQRAKVEVFCWRFAGMGAIFTAGLAGAGWYWWGQHLLPNEHVGVALYSICAILLSTAVTMATTRIRLAGHYRKLAATSLVAAFASVVVSLSVAKFWRADVWALLLGVLISSLTTLMLLGVPSSSDLLRHSGLSTKMKRDAVLLGFAGSITAPMYWVISSSDRWFLAKFASDSIIGIYSMASSIALLGLILNSALFLTWVPEASRVYNVQNDDALPALGRIWERLVVGFAMVWVAVVAAGGDFLRLLAAPQFHSGVDFIPFLAGGVFFYGLAGLANTSFFLNGRMAPVAIFWVVGAIASLGLNMLLTPTLSALGAAIAQTVSFGLLAIAILIASHRSLPIPINWLRLIFCLLLALSVGIILRLPWSTSPLLSLLLKAPIGLLVISLLIVVIAPDWFQRVRVIFKKFFV